MKLIIEARLESGDLEQQHEPIRLASIERPNDDLERLGLSLEEGRELMAAAQSAVVSNHVAKWLTTRDCCRHCCTPYRRKDSRSIVVRTVFGKVSVESPRFWSCTGDRVCSAEPAHTMSPLAEALPRRTTPELEYLQAKWAAHLPYAAATAMLKEVLPLLVWHGKGRKAVPRLQAIGEELEKWPNQELTALWWNVRKVCSYIRSHARFLVNYGARYRKGLPISSSIAESAVNQVVSARMAKKQQMRWSDDGAHALALVRVADLNGELSIDSLGDITLPRRSDLEKSWNASFAMAA